VGLLSEISGHYPEVSIIELLAVIRILPLYCELIFPIPRFLIPIPYSHIRRYGIYYKVETMETATNLNNSGIALTEANRPNDAIPLFRKALGMEPENPLLWLNLGIAQQRTGNYEEAIDSFHRALNIDEGIAEAWLSMGLIYYELEEFDLCRECYNSAVYYDGANPKIWNNMGVLSFTEGDLNEARCCFEEAVSLAPHYYDALYNLRDTCRELGDYRAAAEFERALSGINSRRGPNTVRGTKGQE
jgi:Flp pilus assembly protein TadD